MTVWQIVNQFTSLDFTLVLFDERYLEELYRGFASNIQGEPEADYIVVAMEPPRRAGEVILHVDSEYELTYNEYDYAVTEA